MRFGPYKPPVVRLGEIVMDDARGAVRVHDVVVTGRTTWPRGVRLGRSPGRPAILITGDLVRALRSEAAVDVARYWGVTPQQVRRWRRAIGVGRYTPGTRALFAEQGNMEIGKYAADGARALHSDPEASARRAASHSRAMRERARRQSGNTGSLTPPPAPPAAESAHTPTRPLSTAPPAA